MSFKRPLKPADIGVAHMQLCCVFLPKGPWIHTSICSPQKSYFVMILACSFISIIRPISRRHVLGTVHLWTRNSMIQSEPIHWCSGLWVSVAGLGVSFPAVHKNAEKCMISFYCYAFLIKAFTRWCMLNVKLFFHFHLIALCVVLWSCGLPYAQTDHACSGDGIV